MEFMSEFQPDIELANKLFDGLKKTHTNWGDTLATIGYLLSQVYMSGTENKPKKIDIFIAFPDCELKHKRNKGYKITIEQREQEEVIA